MSKPRSNRRIAHEVVMGRRRPLDTPSVEIVAEEVDRLIKVLESGEAKSVDQRRAANLLKGLLVRKRGRPGHRIKPMDNYAPNIESLAAEWMIKNDSVDFSSAIKCSISDFLDGLAAFDSQRPTFSTIETYYKREKHNRRDEDVAFFREVERNSSACDLSHDQYIAKEFSDSRHEQILAMFRYRHGRNCATRRADSHKGIK